MRSGQWGQGDGADWTVGTARVTVLTGQWGWGLDSGDRVMVLIGQWGQHHHRTVGMGSGQWGQGDGADWTVGTAPSPDSGDGSGQWGQGDGADWTVGTARVTVLTGRWGWGLDSGDRVMVLTGQWGQLGCM